MLVISRAAVRQALSKRGIELLSGLIVYELEPQKLERRPQDVCDDPRSSRPTPAGRLAPESILTSATFASLVAGCADDAGTSTVASADSDTSGVTNAGAATTAPAIRPPFRGSDVAGLVAHESVAPMAVRAAISSRPCEDPSPGAVVVGVWD